MLQNRLDDLRRFLSLIVLIMLLAACAPEATSTAPDFTLESLDGPPISLSEFQGQPVVINFWASWCAPCRFEMPELADKYRALRDAGLVVLGVNVTSQDSVEGAARFVEDFGIPFPILLDVQGEVESLYNASSTPTTIFVDPSGQIVARHYGPMNGEQINEYIDLLTAADS